MGFDGLTYLKRDKRHLAPKGSPGQLPVRHQTRENPKPRKKKNVKWKTHSAECNRTSSRIQPQSVLYCAHLATETIPFAWNDNFCCCCCFSIRLAGGVSARPVEMHAFGLAYIDDEIMVFYEMFAPNKRMLGRRHCA